MSSPIIFLTNAATVAAVERGGDWANAASKQSVGPGPVYSIMRFPRGHTAELGEGRVLALTPPRRLAAPAIKAKRAADRQPADEALANAWARYEAVLREVWARHADRLAPGRLAWAQPAISGQPWDGEFWIRGGAVPRGATLICACARSAASAGRCHRVIAADLLGAAGWRVVLDGKEVT